MYGIPPGAETMPVRPKRGRALPGTAPAGGKNEMDAAIYDCPEAWVRFLPTGTRRIQRLEELSEHLWPLLALTAAGCQALSERRKTRLVCRLLLLPGEFLHPDLAGIQAETVISCGLSPRDSLTLSSLRSPVLCVQRTLPRLDGTTVEPQEFPLPPLPGPVEAMLPLLGLRLLQMPLTDGRFP